MCSEQQGGVLLSQTLGFSVACVASSKVEFRYLQQGGVFSGVCSEQQGGVLLSQTVGFSVVCVASSKVEFCYLKRWGFQWRV